MLIGVPKEIKTDEYRVGLVPATVKEQRAGDVSASLGMTAPSPAPLAKPMAAETSASPKLAAGCRKPIFAFTTSA